MDNRRTATDHVFVALYHTYLLYILVSNVINIMEYQVNRQFYLMQLPRCNVPGILQGEKI